MMMMMFFKLFMSLIAFQVNLLNSIHDNFEQ